METILRGKAHVYGDNIDTDAIIPGKYTKTLDKLTFAAHVLEDLDPNFKHIVQPGDILVAGDNFGCGSSREQAPLALKTAGVAAVVANYFARIFYRNAINIGLPVLELKAHDIRTGDELEIRLREGIVKNIPSNKSYKSVPLPPVMLDILSYGGLTPYFAKFGDYRINPTAE